MQHLGRAIMSGQSRCELVFVRQRIEAAAAHERHAERIGDGILCTVSHLALIGLRPPFGSSHQ
jgi:hypothetical protein